VQSSGGGKIGTSLSASPEQLRFLTVKVSVRGEVHDRNRIHRPRIFKYAPMDTYQLDKDAVGSCPVTTHAIRVTMPAMVARNL
jgi:hypothetical protein